MSTGSFGEPWKVILHGNERYPFPLSIHTADDACWIARDGTVSSTGAAHRIVECVNALTGINNPVDAVERARVSLTKAENVISGFQGDFCREHCSRLKNDHFEECTEATEALSDIRAALAALGDRHE